MKTKFKYYAICWAIMFALFNLIVFLLPNEWYGFNKFGGAFWPSYIFMLLALFGQLFCAWLAFKTENLRKFFYNIPLVTISYEGLIATLVVGSICFAIPDLPNWVAVILCAIILAFTAVAIVQAKVAADMVGDIDNKVKVRTFFIKSLTVDAETLMNSAKDDELRQLLKKAYEALRYSDPMSDPALSDDEIRITKKFDELKQATDELDIDVTRVYVEELLVLIDGRNKKCKLLK